jgi:hypothetical protein
MPDGSETVQLFPSLFITTNRKWSLLSIDCEVFECHPFDLFETFVQKKKAFMNCEIENKKGNLEGGIREYIERLFCSNVSQKFRLEKPTGGSTFVTLKPTNVE